MIRKALDRVRHKDLLYQLDMTGIKGSLHQWISKYFTTRSLRLDLPRITSYWVNMQAGVPPGSSLGPLLFLIYTNDTIDY